MAIVFSPLVSYFNSYYFLWGLSLLHFVWLLLFSCYFHCWRLTTKFPKVLHLLWLFTDYSSIEISTKNSTEFKSSKWWGHEALRMGGIILSIGPLILKGNIGNKVLRDFWIHSWKVHFYWSKVDEAKNRWKFLSPNFWFIKKLMRTEQFKIISYPCEML